MARDYAPDAGAFLRVQSTLIERAGSDAAALRRELDVLLQRASGATHALPLAGGPILVDAYVLWRRTLLAEDPRQQVAGWQELLSRHGDAVLQRSTVAEVAHKAIRELIDDHGRAIYAEVESRACRALAEAGQSREALRAVDRAFPHSEAAAAAQRRLLDAAVGDGDLATAVDVFRVAARSGDDSPGILRRLGEAARRRGNLALVRGAAQRLLAVDAPSDWPLDGGRSLADVAKDLLLLVTPHAGGVRALPTHVVAEIPSPRPPFGFRLLPVHREAGFPATDDEPLLLGFDDQLHAIDLHDGARPTLFTHQCGLVDRVWLCGSTIVVPTLDRIVGLDRRSGAVQWQFAAPGRLLVCYGLVHGVLQVMQRDGDHGVVLMGIEPLSGQALYARPLADKDYVPQPRTTPDDALLVRRSASDDPAIERVDPLTGRGTPGFVLGQDVRRAASHLSRELLQSELLPQKFAATQDLLFVPIDAPLNNGTPLLLAVRRDGSVAWSWTGARGRRLQMESLRADRYVLVEATPASGRVVVIDAATGTVRREVALGSEATVLNWSRQRVAPPPDWVLLSDLDDHGGDRRLIGVPIAGEGEAFAHAIGGATDEVLKTPRVDGDRIVFGVHSQRAVGPVRLFVLGLSDRRSILPGDRSHLLLPVPPRSPHELGAVGPYTVLVTDARISVLDDAKDTR
jgi:hypothetical protein